MDKLLVNVIANLHKTTLWKIEGITLEPQMFVKTWDSFLRELFTEYYSDLSAYNDGDDSSDKLDAYIRENIGALCGIPERAFGLLNTGSFHCDEITDNINYILKVVKDNWEAFNLQYYEQAFRQ